MDKTLKRTAVACGLMMFALSGMATNGFTVYQPYIISVNGFSNAQGSFILTVRNVGALASMLLAGLLYKKTTLRKGIFLVGITMSAGLFVFCAAKSFFAYCAAGFFLGVGFGAGGMIPLSLIISSKYGNRKAVVFSVCAAMTGLTTLGIPVGIVKIIEKRGLPFMFAAEGVCILLLTCLIFLLMKNGPAELTAGAKEENAARLSSAYRPLSSGEMWLYFLICVCGGASGFVGVTHLSVLCTGEGLSSQTAALAVTVSGIALTVSKAFYGSVKKYFGPLRSQIFYGLVVIAGQVLFSWAGKSAAVLYLSVCLYPCGLAFFTVGLAEWAGELALPEKKAFLVQLTQIGYMTGGLVFSSFPGIIADRNNGSYTKAYLLLAALSALACILHLGLCVKHRRPVKYKKA